MDYELSKRNRLKKKFNFNGRDWSCELDGMEDSSGAVGRRNSGRSLSWQVLWQVPLQSEGAGLSVNEESEFEH